MISIGIDATNLRGGGGVTHLTELLRVASPQEHGFRKIVVWAPERTLSLIEEREWLVKRSDFLLDGSLLKRSMWQKFKLANSIHREQCDILFVPGGNISCDFHPVITMSRNMLPFEPMELKRYGWRWTFFRLALLRFLQSRSFSTADGLIFLTQFAHNTIKLKKNLVISGKIAIIPHGLNKRFLISPKQQKAVECYDHDRPLKVLYVSIVDVYKHQWKVIEAMANLRQETGWPLVLDLVGPAYSPALVRLKNAMEKFDSKGEWVTYHGSIHYGDLNKFYERADIGLFASSCENMPNILLETMAAGLPIASSNRGPMVEILEENGRYFDPEDTTEIARCLKELIADPDLRSRLAAASFESAQKFSWKRCADKTFLFINKVYSSGI